MLSVAKTMGITRTLQTTVRCSGWEGKPVKHEPEDLPDHIIIYQGFRVKSTEWEGSCLTPSPRLSASQQKNLTVMNRKILFFWMLLASGQAAWAQEATDTMPRQLDQVVVTATKYPVKQSQTGKVVIVVTHDELEKSIGKPLGEVLSEQAGITVSGSLNSPGTNESVFIRGAGSGRALVLVDGVPVSDPTQTDNSFDINLIPVTQIERVEISKGAQSTLYGSDAIAGVINIITVKSDVKKPFNGKAGVSAGNYASYNGNVQVYGKVADRFSYNVRYNHDHSNGFNNVTDTMRHGVPPVPFHHNGYTADQVAGNVAWNPVGPLTVKGFLQYSDYQLDVDAGPFQPAADYTNTSKGLLAGGGVEYKLSNTTIHGNYLYTASNRLLLEDSVLGQTYMSDHYLGRTQYAEIYANTSLGYGLTWLNGADYRFSAMNENGVYGTYPLSFKDTSMSQNSMYSSVLYSGHSGLSAELGGRLNTDSRYGSNYTYTFNPAWLIDRNWKVYGSIASSFKAPTLFQLYSAYGNPGLRPERSTSFEAGLQYNGGGLNTRATYFHRKTDDGITYNFFTNAYFNLDQEKGDGIEWEGSVKLSPMVSVSANYTWVKMQERAQSHVSYNDTTYDYALRVPEHTVNITLGLRPIPGSYLGLTGHYESIRYDIGGYDANYKPLPDAALGSFFILNCYAEYRLFKQLKVFVTGRNITNTKFVTIYGYNSIPAMWTGGATVEF
jgi:vitamin B12 transporter